MNSEDKPANLSRCRDNSAQSSTCRPHLESHTSRSENSDTFLWWCLHVYKDNKKKWLKILVKSKAINIGLLCSVIGWKTNSGCTHFFSALHSAALWALLRNLLTRVFPRFSPAVFASLIGKFERLLALWLADAITSVFTHEDPTENALRRFPINETVVELGYNAVPRLEKSLACFKGTLCQRKPCSIDFNTCITDANFIRFCHIEK